MNCHSTILINELLGSSIHTREASSVLINLVQNDPCDHIELDFSAVDYISRAFADQFHVDKMNCASHLHKSIIVSNASDEVINMLQAVAKSQNTSNRKIQQVPIYKYSSYRQLEEFLLSF